MNNNEFPQNLPENPKALESYSNTEKIIQNLGKASGYKRQNEGDKIFIESEGEKLEIKRIVDQNSEEAEELDKFMRESFNGRENEIDSLENTKSAIGEAGANAYYVAKNPEGKIVALVQGSLYDIEPGENAGNKTFFSFDYVAVSKAKAGKKIDRELYIVSLKFALENARAKRKELTALMWGAVDRRVELFASRSTGLEFQTACFEDAEGNFHEVPFNNPPFNWDINTGLPIDPETQKAGKKNPKEYGVPEILMLKMLDGRNELSAGELIALIKSYWEDNCVLQNINSAVGNEAARVNQEIVDSFISDLEKHISQAEDGKIMLLGASEKSKKKKELEVGEKKFIMSEVK